MHSDRRHKKRSSSSRSLGGYTSRPALRHNTTSQASTISSQTVNERLEFLRRTQNPRPTNLTSAQILRSTHETSALVESRHAPLHLRRRVAGPPPPRSWIENAANPGKRYEVDDDNPRYPKSLDCFPDTNSPEPLSLMHQALKSMAKQFDWHVEYDHIYLSVLPKHVKTLLFNHITWYGPPEGVSLAGLKTLCATVTETKLEESTGTESFTRLDLGGALGRNLNFKQLGKFWTSKPIEETRKASGALSHILESWEDESPDVCGSSDENLPPLGSLSLKGSPLRFPQLTHLSLSHPHSSVSWADLVEFSANLGALTHLSLGHWPSPAGSAAVQRDATDIRPVNIESDDAAAVYRLWRLSKNTSSLEYLSLRGCHEWMYLLMSTASATSASIADPTAVTGQDHAIRPQPRRNNRTWGIEAASSAFDSALAGKDTKILADWAGAWRGIKVLDISQGQIPTHTDAKILAALHMSRGRTGNYSYPLAPQNHARPRQAYAESYRILVPNDKVGNEIVARQRSKVWTEGEIEALRLERWIRGQRRQRGGSLKVCFGWEKTDLVAAGYDEGALFQAGL